MVASDRGRVSYRPNLPRRRFSQWKKRVSFPLTAAGQPRIFTGFPFARRAEPTPGAPPTQAPAESRPNRARKARWGQYVLVLLLVSDPEPDTAASQAAEWLPSIRTTRSRSPEILPRSVDATTAARPAQSQPFSSYQRTVSAAPSGQRTSGSQPSAFLVSLGSHTKWFSSMATFSGVSMTAFLATLPYASTT